MPVSVSHPLVADYLARLDTASAGLAPGRRAELRAEIESHLAEALPPHAGEGAVRDALDRLGDPADIVAAESDDDGSPAVVGVPVPVPARPSPWGPLEIGAVALLTVGFFVLPVVGPAIGLVLAWVSARWTRREKVVATVWTLLPVVVIVLGGLAVLTVRTTTGDAVVTPAVSVTSAPLPSPEVTP